MYSFMLFTTQYPLLPQVLPSFPLQVLCSFPFTLLFWEEEATSVGVKPPPAHQISEGLGTSPLTEASKDYLFRDVAFTGSETAPAPVGRGTWTFNFDSQVFKFSAMVCL